MRDGRLRKNSASVLLVFWTGWSTIPACMASRKGKKRAKRKASPRRRGSGREAKLPKEAVTLIVILRAREGQESLLEAELRALVGPSRKEEDCLTYNLHRAI